MRAVVTAAALGSRGAESSRLVSPLARLHSGHLGDDVAWLFLGVALLSGIVAIAAP